MRAPPFTEKLLAYHTRFERRQLILRLHGKDVTEEILPPRPPKRLPPVQFLLEPRTGRTDWVYGPTTMR